MVAAACGFVRRFIDAQIEPPRRFYLGLVVAADAKYLRFVGHADSAHQRPDSGLVDRIARGDVVPIAHPAVRSACRGAGTVQCSRGVKRHHVAGINIDCRVGPLLLAGDVALFRETDLRRKRGSG